MKASMWIAASALLCLGHLCGEDRVRQAALNVIGPDDTIGITALDCDEISKSWRVSSSGDINLPIVGRVRVSGKTPEVVEQELVEKLKPYILEPHVAVFISERRSRPVTVSGLVPQPGTYQASSGGTLFEAIMLAGGPKEPAALVTLVRPGAAGAIPLAGVRHDAQGDQSSIELDLKTVMDVRSDAAKLRIMPKDNITLSPAKEQHLVYIMGEVTKPGSVELVTQSTISITKLLAVSGGLTRTASPKNTKILHLGAGGTQTEVATVNLKQILAGGVKDLELSAGDIVVVPSSQMTNYFHAASLAAVTTGIYVLGRF